MNTDHKNSRRKTRKNNVLKKQKIIFPEPKKQSFEFFHWKIQIHKLVFFLLLCILGGIGITLFISSQFKPVTDTITTETHKVPKEIKKKEQQFATPSASFRVPILMYHYVEHVQNKKDTMRMSLNIPPETFEQQIQTLQNAGYTFMTASELADVLDGRNPLPQKPVLLTFDDGHWDLYTEVLPILEKYHIKATAYIITGFIGGSDFLTPLELQKVIASGLIEIGAHTVNHISLAGKLSPIVQFEVNQSKETLESTYHLHVVSFAYPNGSFDQQAVDVVKNAGFRTAVSTIPGIEQNQINRFFLYRIRPGYRIGPSLLEYLNQNTFRPW